MAGIETVEEDEEEAEPGKAGSQQRRSSSAATPPLPPLSPRRAACYLLRPAFGVTTVHLRRRVVLRAPHLLLLALARPRGLVLLPCSKEVHDYLKSLCPDLHITRGEYDEDARYPETKALAIGQFKLGLCHGHQSSIKWNQICLLSTGYLRDLLAVCEAQRQIGEAGLNETSSRSHQILRLNFVDLELIEKLHIHTTCQLPVVCPYERNQQEQKIIEVEKPMLEKGLVSPVKMILPVKITVSTWNAQRMVLNKLECHQAQCLVREQLHSRFPYTRNLNRTRVIWMSSVDAKTGTPYTGSSNLSFLSWMGK